MNKHEVTEKQQIKVRKKRFFAFLLSLALVVSVFSSVPMKAKASENDETTEAETVHEVTTNGLFDVDHGLILGSGDDPVPPTPTTYTIRFKNYDGTTLQTRYMTYGTTPSYTKETPTKPEDDEYTYEFAGWNPAITRVTGSKTYTAVFNAIPKAFNVTWADYDGTVLETDENVDPGTVPTYDGAEPKRENTAQYTYKFTGWTPEVVAVDKSATYTATYSETLNQYTVTWKNEDGKTLETDKNVDYGTTPTYDGAEPTKKADAQYTYTFAGWDPQITEVTGNATYTATYQNTVNTYTIKFVDENGGLISENRYDYGTPAGQIEKPADPTKDKDDANTYTFAGWSPAVADVTGDATYKATFMNTVNQYTVTFVDEDGETVLKEATKYPYGTKAKDIKKPADPKKQGDAQYSYKFIGWSPEVDDVKKDITYTAAYSQVVNKYLVTFLNEDSSVLSAESYEYGTAADEIKVPADPKKASDKKYSYEFDGWDPEIRDVKADAVYRPTFKKELIPTTEETTTEETTTEETTTEATTTEAPKPEPTTTATPTTTQAPTTEAQKPKADAPTTGDVPLYAWLLMALAFAGCSVMCIMGGKKREDGEEEPIDNITTIHYNMNHGRNKRKPRN